MVMQQAAGVAATPLPTRVNKACDRCRKNKSRCDPYRPCSLCVRASAQCQTSELKSAQVDFATPRTTSDAVYATQTNKRKRPDDTRYQSSAQTTVAQSMSPTVEPVLQRQRSRTLQGSPVSSDFENVNGESAISIARKISTLQRQPTVEHAVHAIPGANDSPADATTTRTASTASYLMYALPDQETIGSLLEEYFDSVHWFSLVVLEPKFRVACGIISLDNAAPAEKSFLLLLCTILGIAAWYKSHKIRDSNGTLHRAWLNMSKNMIANAETQIVDIMDQRSITAVQTLILLGSYYVYHGRPNLSFSLLGATIKASQSLGLHQEPPQTTGFLDREERKRVWWTCYTWDRFASINYGRPLGISEKVCSVVQPEDLDEDPHFGGTPQSEAPTGICYSPYQRELNKVYLIASPAIERVYRAPTDDQLKTAAQYLNLVNEVTTQLFRWRSELPKHLQLDIERDWPSSLSTEESAYKLQALSLHLTFDSLVLTLHRPFMKQRLDSVLSESSPHIFDDAQSSAGTTSSHANDYQPPTSGDIQPTSDTPSHEQLWHAAVRTARITELPQMAQHATDGHLITFLAINLFNAAVVLIVMALSDPLSDRAQEAKRRVARIHRLLATLGSRAVLSQQSATVLRSLIELLIARESDALLAYPGDQPSQSVSASFPHNGGRGHTSVRDALSLPLWTNSGAMNDSKILQHAREEPDGRTRIQRGLESVQRAFNDAAVEYANYSGLSSNQGGGAIAIDRQGQEQSQSYNAPGYMDTSTSNINFGMDDTGMHWIWDPMWDNLFDAQ